MKRGEVLRDERLKHLEELRKLGIDPYPATVLREQRIADALHKTDQSVAVAGRVVAIRSHGKAAFLDLVDETGKIQVYAKAEELEGKQFAIIELLDTGDFLAVQGKVFVTKMGETTVHTDKLQFLSKALRPMPTEWQGLKDPEERFRKRYIDMLLNPEVREAFGVRRRTLAGLRTFMDQQGFVEVDTPILQPIQGGASAKPFATHYNAYETDVYLRVAPELYLKRLLVGGYERVYEIGKNFRNEGADPTHNPEFTNMEFYAAYWDEEQVMDFAEDLIIALATHVLGTPRLVVGGQTIELTKPFKRVTFKDITNGAMTDQVLKVETKKLLNPTFVLDHPRELVPLAKARTETLARSFQLYLGGLELVKAFAELNDPLDQRSQFDEQMRRRDAGDEEAQVIDEDFLEALEYGMPPAGGFGIGLERLITLFAGQDSLRQTMYFPFMKPRKNNDQHEEEAL